MGVDIFVSFFTSEASLAGIAPSAQRYVTQFTNDICHIRSQFSNYMSFA